jgi:hypothetical protein
MTDPGTTNDTTQTEGQTARDIFPEDDGIPEVAQDDSPGMQRAEDPEFMAMPGESPTATVDHGTTAFEQAEGESLSGRLDREVPDTGLDPTDDVRAAETHDRTVPQISQDGVSEQADSFTDSVTDDVTAGSDDPTGGEGPEERAMHLTDG